MVTLLILVGATWMGSVPGQAHHAAGADAGGRGARDRRRAPRSARRAAEQRRVRLARRGVQRDGGRAGDEPPASVERSTIELERKHVEVEGRRRYIETILERITTGVVSVDASRRDHDDQQRRGAAAQPRSRRSSASRRAAVFDRADLQPLGALLAGRGRARAREPAAQEIAIARDGQELHLAAVATALVGDSGAAEGVVLVLDDVTPLIRAQKVAAWREVARRLAHEIKNPLTPIQLSAERLRRHFAGAPPRPRRSSTSARRRSSARSSR